MADWDSTGRVIIQSQGGAYQTLGQSFDILLNLFRKGLFRVVHWWRGAKRPPFPKICHTCTTMMKLGTVLPYLKKIQKLKKSCDTLHEFCWYQHFLPQVCNFIIWRNTDIDCILIHSFKFLTFLSLYRLLQLEWLQFWWCQQNWLL